MSRPNSDDCSTTILQGLSKNKVVFTDFFYNLDNITEHKDKFQGKVFLTPNPVDNLIMQNYSIVSTFCFFNYTTDEPSSSVNNIFVNPRSMLNTSKTPIIMTECNENVIHDYKLICCDYKILRMIPAIVFAKLNNKRVVKIGLFDDNSESVNILTYNENYETKDQFKLLLTHLCTGGTGYVNIDNTLFRLMAKYLNEYIQFVTDIKVVIVRDDTDLNDADMLNNVLEYQKFTF